jgi:hypothetical protein
MIPLPPRQLLITSPNGRQRLKSVPQWGIPIESAVTMQGRRLLLIVGEDGEPLPIVPNPRYVPETLLGDE